MNGSIWNVVETVLTKVFYVSDAVIAHHFKSFVDFFVDLGLNEEWTVSLVESSLVIIFFVRIGIKSRNVWVADGYSPEHS